MTSNFRGKKYKRKDIIKELCETDILSNHLLAVKHCLIELKIQKIKVIFYSRVRVHN